MFNALKRRYRPRRGVTLVEMLVVVALVILMMVILVQIFQSALGAMSASRTTQELDVVLRSIDSMIRSDLAGVTAKLTPPNNPSLKQGYFEYGENAAADLQGEDTDDFLAFTTKAPEGQVFTGRQYLFQLNTTTGQQLANQTVQPATVTSQLAEIIYFVRNGNLYRRVFLVAPERKTSIATTYNQVASNANKSNANPGCDFGTSMFGNSIKVSWQGMNEISCRPGGYILTNTPSGQVLQPQAPIPNNLGDLTNRENRAFHPRFLNDFVNNQTTPFTATPDGIPDDSNGDGIPDYYPTLYYNGVGNPQIGVGWAPNYHVLENPNLAYPQSPIPGQRIQKNPWDVYAFPFIYPGMYSVPDPNRLPSGPLNLLPSLNLGWVHYLPPNTASGYLNHSPLDLGETPGFMPSGFQTWWGFPTWRETLAGASSPGGVGWVDPINFVNYPLGQQHQPVGLMQFNPAITPQKQALAAQTFLPPVNSYGSVVTPFASPYGFDTAGSTFASTNFLANPAAPATVWQDDLILTNVRSFDVKAYDPYAPLYSTSVNYPLSAGYWDLGYAGLVQNPSALGYQAPNYGANSTIYGVNGSASNPYQTTPMPFQGFLGEPQGFGHEGRIPPLTNDYRLDPRRGGVSLVVPGQNANLLQLNNIGDDNPGVNRLTHTFDTWSTDYVYAPDSDLLLWESSPVSVPIYPAFPPPYPTPLRGIQIQIRVTDPRNERTKVLTIRFDLTDKL